MISVTPQEVHLWFTEPEGIQDPELLESYHRLMNHEEAVQQKRFHFEEHRHQYLITRALVRTTLSRYSDQTPEEWVFHKNEYGRPYVEWSPDEPQLHFNLSHTKGLIALAVTQGQAVGVDVEQQNRSVSTTSLAKRFFSSSEAQDLLSHSLEEQQQRFFDYWTLKEAYIKARGMGISLPLDQFSFHLLDPEARRASFDLEGQSPEQWTFCYFTAQPGYAAALAVERPHPITLSIYDTIPGVSSYELRQTHLLQQPLTKL